ncbi:MAG: TlpA disulfide reductase family protein [Casimicrobiaceae bacterium]
MLTIGPFALAWERLAIVAALLVVFVVVGIVPSTRRAMIERALALTLLAALIGGRVTYVLLHATAYLGSPLDALAIWDGGISWFAAAASALIVATDLARRHALAIRDLMRPLLAGSLVWLAFGVAQAWHDTGKSAEWPEASLDTVGGQTVGLATFRGQPIVVNLWATWCAPCRNEMPLLANAAQKHRDITFLFLDQREPAPVVARFLASESLVLRNVLLDQDAVFRGFGDGVLPTTLFFDATGKLAARHVGALSTARLEAYLDALR